MPITHNTPEAYVGIVEQCLSLNQVAEGGGARGIGIEKPDFSTRKKTPRDANALQTPSPRLRLTHITRHEHVPQSTIVFGVGRPRDARIIIALDDDLLLLFNNFLDDLPRRRHRRPPAPST